LTPQQASKSGVMVFRGTNPKTLAGPAPLTLYGVSPLIEMNGAGKLTIERIDQQGERRVVDVAGTAQRALYDCAKEGLALTPGGMYRASVGSRTVVFKIADSAKPGALPPVGRLVHL
jgi:hypothetical protein